MSSALSECPWSSYICWPTIDVFYFWTQPLTIPEVFGRTWCPQFVFQKSKHPEHSQLTILRGIHAKSLQSWPSGLFATLWTVAYQAPLSIGFSRQEYWSGLPCPAPGDLPDPGIEPESPASQVDSLLLSHQGRLRSSVASQISCPEELFCFTWLRADWGRDHSESWLLPRKATHTVFWWSDELKPHISQA